MCCAVYTRNNTIICNLAKCKTIYIPICIHLFIELHKQNDNGVWPRWISNELPLAVHAARCCSLSKLAQQCKSQTDSADHVPHN